ncbi:unnamed protein product [Pleuronectes platessa]|uniref:Uncharacterized protein n=1 Tax=Pleuronectes platessa TaxID=8262 RepID=A0A9N7Z529_PLEPL|nr:unnamed protein product [Pleuronectes platessa]
MEREVALGCQFFGRLCTSSSQQKGLNKEWGEGNVVYVSSRPEWFLALTEAAHKSAGPGGMPALLRGGMHGPSNGYEASNHFTFREYSASGVSGFAMSQGARGESEGPRARLLPLCQTRAIPGHSGSTTNLCHHRRIHPLLLTTCYTPF